MLINLKKKQPIKRLIFSLICIAWLAMISSCVSSQNIAQGKSYSLSLAPNYQNAFGVEKHALTDESYAAAAFWTSKETLGWQNLPGKLFITLDLKKPNIIGSILLNSFRSNKGDINFPQNAFVFISLDNKTYRYVGDAADVYDNLPGDLRAKKFSLTDINQKARFVKVVVIPDGRYFFCDELQVLKGRTISNMKLASYPLKSLDLISDSLKMPENTKRNLQAAVLKFKSSNDWATAKSGLDTIIADSLFFNITSSANLAKIRVYLGRSHALRLQQKFSLPFIVEKFNPWDSLNMFRQPKTDPANCNFQFSVLKDNVRIGSFVITNLSLQSEKYTFRFSGDTTMSAFELFEVPPVFTSSYRITPDPLLPISDSVTINPGVSQMFLFKLKGRRRGVSNSTITILTDKKQMELPVEIQVFEQTKGRISNNLNANVWAYPNSPMLKRKPSDVAADLNLHHVNTIVVPPKMLPDMESNDVISLHKYLSYFKGVRNILLYLDYKNPYRMGGGKNLEFLSGKWKKEFVSWYQRIRIEIQSIGSSGSQIYLYPYDEMSLADFSKMKMLVTWAKREIPGIKFYATSTSNQLTDLLVPLVDIVQILSSNHPSTEYYSKKHAEVWMYRVSAPSNALSPYTHYRLLAWTAFLNDYKGIGFWNYADERNGDKLNLISGGAFNPEGSYSVIYNSPDGSIISSRRWEAFSLGIEDYSLLQTYSSRFGIDRAKELCRQVIQQPDRLGLADSVKEKIIKELAGAQIIF